MITIITVIAIAALLGGALWYSFRDKDNRTKGTGQGGSVEKDNTKPKNRR